MATPAVAAVANKLTNYLHQEASLVYGVRDEVDWLERELRGMLSFLRDAESKRKGNNERVENWVRDVREVAYEAEDVIDNFMLAVGRRASFHRYTSFLTSIGTRYEVAKKIKKIKARIKEISDRRVIYGIANLGESGGGDGGSVVDDNIQARRRLSPHHYDDNSTIGLEEGKEMILKQLLNEEKRLSVISIVGMGGLGKTTLAKKVYHSREIQAEFPIRVWVLVSQDYRVVELLKKIIKAIIGEQDTENLDEENLKEKLSRLLEQGRYLIVMDDVWSREVWERIDTAFPDSGNGSRVIFTTRQIDVAKRADPTITPYALPMLDKTKSQKLLLKKAFPYRDIQEFPSDLKDIGEQLVSKCHGLPLALVVLGGLLSTKEQSRYAWSRVLNSSDWQIMEECKPILSISYEDLRYDLKPCFLYIGSFPKGSEIEAERLIKLWIAEDYIRQQPQKTTKETAREFLDDLVQRCMIQITEKAYDGAIGSICIHDLLRDLCLDEARHIGFLMVKKGQVDDTSTSSAVMTARRLALHNHEDFGYLNSSMEHKCKKKLRALFVLNLRKDYNVISKTIGGALDGLRLLRVIDVKSSYSTGTKGTIKLPKKISTLIHLRYLRLDFLGMCSVLLPSAGNLRNLQTLEVSKLTIGSNSGIGSLKDLQVLRDISAGRWIENDLAKLTGLCDLAISNIRHSDKHALVKSLGKLHHLQSLSLEGELIPVEALESLAEHRQLQELSLAGSVSLLFNNLPKMPPSLSTLTLSRSSLEKDPMTVLATLTNLVKLDLAIYSYVGRRMHCSAGGFPRLQRLRLDNLPLLQYWSVEAGAMPSLTHLTMRSCQNLKMLPEGLQHVTTLQELELQDMPGELRERVRKRNGEDWYKVRHIPSIIVDVIRQMTLDRIPGP